VISRPTTAVRSLGTHMPGPGPLNLNGASMDKPPAVPAKKLHVLDHPIARHVLTALRNRHTPAAEIRGLSNQLLALLAFEATRSLATRDESIEVDGASDPLIGKVLAKPVVFLSLVRHGLGLAHNLADFIPGVSIGTISLEYSGDRKRVESRLHLVNSPTLRDSRVMLFDPIIGSGISVGSALTLVHRSGAADIALLSFVTSAEGLSHVQAALPDVAIWTAAIDPDLDSKRGPLPGIGDYAARLYA